MADNIKELFGTYSSNYLVGLTKTPYQALFEVAEKTFYAPGCLDKDKTKCTIYNRTSIIEAIGGGEIIFLCMGTGSVCITKYFSLN